MTDNFEQLKDEVLGILRKAQKKEHTLVRKALQGIENNYNILPRILGKSVEKAGYPVGTIREWKGKKYIKVAPNKWKRKYDKNERGAANSIGRMISKVEKMNDPMELFAFVAENRKQFMGMDGFTISLYTRLEAAAERRINEIDSSGAKTTLTPGMKEAYKYLAKRDKAKSKKENKNISSEKTDNSKAESSKEQPTATATTNTEAPKEDELKKPDIINGKWNEKIYGFGKKGYSIYVDGNKVNITPEQKKEIENYLKERDEKAIKKQLNEGYARVVVKTLERRVNLNVDSVREKKDLFIKQLKKELPNILDYIKANADEKRGKPSFNKPYMKPSKSDWDNAPENLAEMVWERIVKDEESAEKIHQEFEAIEKKRLDRLNVQSTVDEYIKEHGTPSLVSGSGYWNGKVYGSEKFGYSVYVDGKKKILKDKDLREFGLKQDEEKKEEKTVSSNEKKEPEEKNVELDVPLYFQDKSYKAPRTLEEAESKSSEELTDIIKGIERDSVRSRDGKETEKYLLALKKVLLIKRAKEYGADVDEYGNVLTNVTTKNGERLRQGDFVKVENSYNQNGFYKVENNLLPFIHYASSKQEFLEALNHISLQGVTKKGVKTQKFNNWPLTRSTSLNEAVATKIDEGNKNATIEKADINPFEAQKEQEKTDNKDKTRITSLGVTDKNGKYYSLHYSLSDDGNSVSIYPRNGMHIPKELEDGGDVITNDSDIMTDYFEDDNLVVTPKNKWFSQIKAIAKLTSLLEKQKNGYQDATSEKLEAKYAKNEMNSAKVGYEHLAKWQEEDPTDPEYAVEALKALKEYKAAELRYKEAFEKWQKREKEVKEYNDNLDKTLGPEIKKAKEEFAKAKKEYEKKNKTVKKSLINDDGYGIHWNVQDLFLYS